MTNTNAIELTRQAGNIIRSHTNYQHGQKTVGEHTYNLVNIILLLHPNPSLNLVRAAMWHDVPERITGDLPSPVKAENPTLNAELEKIEGQVMENYGLAVDLTDDEKKWLKAADKMEYLLWAEEQLAMGNTTVEHAMGYARKWLASNAPPEINDYLTPKNVIDDTNITSNHYNGRISER